MPGHERFVRTMISGATGIDLALLVVACDDGVMPQTREHVAILELLGVRTAVVALTKRDLVDAESAQLARADVDDLLAGTALASAAVVETSARSGAGLDELRAALDRAAEAVEPRPATGATRLPVDRAFTLHGIGTVVTGTLWSGTIAAGDRLAVTPGGAEVRVRSVEVHDEAVERATAGRRVAASLVGVERSAIPRGASLTTPGAFPESYRLDVELHALPGGPGVAHGALVQVLLGTACADARVALLEPGPLAAGSAGLAQLRLRERVAAARGDRVIVRTTAPQATIAGGLVLDPAPPRHGATDEALARLRLLASGDAPSLVRAALGGAAWPLALGEIAPAGLLDRDAALAALAELCASGELLRLAGAEPAWLAAARYAELREEVREQLERRAAEHPLEPALPAGAVVPAGSGADALLALLAAEGVLERDGAHVLRVGARADAAGAHARRGGRRPRGARARRVHATRPAGPASGIGHARARVHRALRRARAQRPDRALRRRPGLHERALRPGARARGGALRRARVDCAGRVARRPRREPPDRAGPARAPRRGRGHPAGGRPPRAAPARLG